jgi:hypothetical protein
MNAARVKLVVGWLWVGVPLGWGVWQTALKAAQLTGEASTVPLATPSTTINSLPRQQP